LVCGIVLGTQVPLYGRQTTESEQQDLTAGRRAAGVSVLQRCQIDLSSTLGQRVPGLARPLDCSEQTVRIAVHAFDERGGAGGWRIPPLHHPC
jgi:hypothetical protein